MSAYDIVEVPFGPEDFETSLEDEFTLTRLKAEIDAVTDIDQLRQGTLKLLQLAIMRQSMIRGLVRRLAQYESDLIRRPLED